MAAILALSLRRLGRIEVVTLVPGVEAKGEVGREPKKTQARILLLVQKISLHFLFKNKSRFQTNVGRCSAHFSYLVPVTFFAL